MYILHHSNQQKYYKVKNFVLDQTFYNKLNIQTTEIVLNWQAYIPL